MTVLGFGKWTLFLFEERKVAKEGEDICWKARLRLVLPNITFLKMVKYSVSVVD